MNSLLFLLLSLLLHRTYGSFDSTRKLHLKWIETSTRDNYKNVVLSNVLPENSGFTCVWYKANGKMVDEAGLNYGGAYKYRRTDRECSLVLAKYESLQQIDFYEPIVAFQKRRIESKEPIYALALLDSFKLVKKEKSLNVYEYNCRAVFKLPYTSDDQLGDAMIAAVDRNVDMSGVEVGSGDYPAALSVSSGSQKIIEREELHQKRRRQQDTQHHTVKYAITLNAIEVIKPMNSKSVFTCTLKLTDESQNKVVYTKVISAAQSILVLNKFLVILLSLIISL